jgi:DDE_Tnp_1-associated
MTRELGIEAAVSFYEQLKGLSDVGDRRGKRHDLSFVLFGVILCVISGRSTVSDLQRYIKNRIEWLREIVGEPEAKIVSRAQLPRILAGVNVAALNKIIEKQFAYRLQKQSDSEWIAIDSKMLNGHEFSDYSQEQRVLVAVNHQKK